MGSMAGDRFPVLAIEYRPVGKRHVGQPRVKWVPEQVQMSIIITSKDLIPYQGPLM